MLKVFEVKGLLKAGVADMAALKAVKKPEDGEARTLLDKLPKIVRYTWSATDATGEAAGDASPGSWLRDIVVTPGGVSLGVVVTYPAAVPARKNGEPAIEGDFIYLTKKDGAHLPGFYEVDAGGVLQDMSVDQLDTIEDWRPTHDYKAGELFKFTPTQATAVDKTGNKLVKDEILLGSYDADTTSGANLDLAEIAKITAVASGDAYKLVIDTTTDKLTLKKDGDDQDVIDLSIYQNWNEAKPYFADLDAVKSIVKNRISVVTTGNPTKPSGIYVGDGTACLIQFNFADLNKIKEWKAGEKLLKGDMFVQASPVLQNQVVLYTTTADMVMGAAWNETEERNYTRLSGEQHGGDELNVDSGMLTGYGTSFADYVAKYYPKIGTILKIKSTAPQYFGFEGTSILCREGDIVEKTATGWEKRKGGLETVHYTADGQLNPYPHIAVLDAGAANMTMTLLGDDAIVVYKTHEIQAIITNLGGEFSIGYGANRITTTDKKIDLNEVQRSIQLVGLPSGEINVII
jgi:hypothetical protein